MSLVSLIRLYLGLVGTRLHLLSMQSVTTAHISYIMSSPFHTSKNPHLLLLDLGDMTLVLTCHMYKFGSLPSSSPFTSDLLNDSFYESFLYLAYDSFGLIA